MRGKDIQQAARQRDYAEYVPGLQGSDKRRNGELWRNRERYSAQLPNAHAHIRKPHRGNERYREHHPAVGARRQFKTKMKRRCSCSEIV